MSFRIKLSVVLICLGIIMAFLPYKQNKISQKKPNELLDIALTERHFFTVDEIARLITLEDSTLLLIDLRSPGEYTKFTLPGAINIPYADLLNKELEGYLDQPGIITVFFSNGDVLPNYAWIFASRLGYVNNFVMKGGLNEWFTTIMYSEFTGKRISAKENALFETRYKARRLFTQINSLPDSLRAATLVAKRKEERQLDGGCEF